MFEKYVEIDAAKPGVPLAFPGFYTLPDGKIPYGMLRSLEVPYTEKSVCRTLGFIPSHFNVHYTKGGIPFVLPYSDKGELTTFNFARLSPRKDLQEVMYDFIASLGDERKTVGLVEEKLPVSAPLVLPYGFLIHPRLNGFTRDESEMITMTLTKQFIDSKKYSVTFNLNVSIKTKTNKIDSFRLAYWLTDLPPQVQPAEEPDGEIVIDEQGTALQGTVWRVNLEEAQRKNGFTLESNGITTIDSAHDPDETTIEFQEKEMNLIVDRLVKHALLPSATTIEELLDLTYL